MSPSSAPSRSATDRSAWIDAAMAAFDAGGLGSVRVEVLARELGVTKGSFYWHFGARADLVAAVLERWEERQTDAMIADSQLGDNPADQLHRLLVVVTSQRQPWERRGEQLLYWEAEHEGVRAALERVTRRRIDYVTELLIGCGIERDEAERRATLALTASLGLQQLSSGVPGALRRRALQRGRLIESLYALLTS